MIIIITLIRISIVMFTSKLNISAEIKIFEFETPNRAETVFLSSFGISYERFVSFNVKACQESNLIIQTRNPEHTSSIVLGGWNNTKSVIRRYGYFEDVLDGKHLSCNVFKPFWISWEKRGITVGQGEVGNNPILTLSSTEKFEIADIGVFTWKGHKGKWQFHITSVGWGSWYSDGDCSVSCGTGVQRFKRDCENPLPGNFVTNCVGNTEELRECQNEGCHVSKWSYFKDLNITKTEMEEAMKDELKDIKAKIAVDPKNTTSSIRRHISASDDRPSAASVGYAGATLLAIPAVLLVACDCLRLNQKSKRK